MQRRYREAFDDLIANGPFDEEPMPGSLAINSSFMLDGGNEDRDPTK